jgi:hypothetical protein
MLCSFSTITDNASEKHIALIDVDKKIQTSKMLSHEPMTKVRVFCENFRTVKCHFSL